jgi:hypothetical protein
MGLLKIFHRQNRAQNGLKLSIKQLASKRSSDFSLCPYCSKFLQETPKRKKKCQHCGEYIYVRTLPEPRVKVLVTSSEAELIDAEWSKIENRKRYIGMLSFYKITEADFEQRRKQLSGHGKTTAKDRDVVWSFLNELIFEYGKKLEFKQMSILYYTQALILDEAGRDFLPVLKESRKMELLDMKRIGIKKARIITAAGEHACNACQKLSDRVIYIEDALNIMPLPCKECSYSVYSNNPGFCRCYYEAIIELEDFQKE